MKCLDFGSRRLKIPTSIRYAARNGRLPIEVRRVAQILLALSSVQAGAFAGRAPMSHVRESLTLSLVDLLGMLRRHQRPVRLIGIPAVLVIALTALGLGGF